MSKSRRIPHGGAVDQDPVKVPNAELFGSLFAIIGIFSPAAIITEVVAAVGGSLWPVHTGRVDSCSRWLHSHGQRVKLPQGLPIPPWEIMQRSRSSQASGKVTESGDFWALKVPRMRATAQLALWQRSRGPRASGNEISLAVRACLLREIPAAVLHGRRIRPKTCLTESTVGSLRTPAAPPTTGTPWQIPFTVRMRTVVCCSDCSVK